LPAELAQQTALETPAFDSTYKLSLSHPVQDKNFYLLSLFQRDHDVRKLLIKNAVLRQVATDKLLALKKASTCSNVNCFDELIRFDDQSIQAVATELESLANVPEIKLLIRRDLRPSGVFIKYSNESDAQMLVAAWKDAVKGMNRILSIY